MTRSPTDPDSGHQVPRSAGGEPLLSIRDLAVDFRTPQGRLNAVRGVSFDVRPGEFVGVVGESGSGKSVTMMSLLGLLPTPPAEIVSGSATFEGVDLLALDEDAIRPYRGGHVGVIFQDPMSSLNPLRTIGWQLAEIIRNHQPSLGRSEVKERVIALLRSVEIADAESRLKQFPHEFSGGMRQRVMIAMAIANTPRLVIADEPTTALDVTIQAQVLSVLRKAQEETDAAIVLITHDLGIISSLADRVVVMYAGQVVEHGPVEEVFRRPSHPYTKGLLLSSPRLDGKADRLSPIPGQPATPANLPKGCAFAPRCPVADGRDLCHTARPTLEPSGTQRGSRCFYWQEVANV